ncbi:hypothetical protein C1H46_023005 [Malus baccata]|uniref:Exportin-2 C-terminal domain-containing protein n=1 Tax=Malus baccata TaxID=106549 RepID=A0A540LY12_MALBA|nr:hypothetical protein C1H46_023005 [Malus baccata]
MLESSMTLLARPEQGRVEEDPEMPDIAENAGYSATFVHLHNAGKREDDPLKDIRDPKEFLVNSLARLAALSPGRYPQVFSQYLDPTNQAELHRLCEFYKCPIA